MPIIKTYPKQTILNMRNNCYQNQQVMGPNENENATDYSDAATGSDYENQEVYENRDEYGYCPVTYAYTALVTGMTQEDERLRRQEACGSSSTQMDNLSFANPKSDPSDYGHSTQTVETPIRRICDQDDDVLLNHSLKRVRLSANAQLRKNKK
jgi:hypothetical protein